MTANADRNWGGIISRGVPNIHSLGERVETPPSLERQGEVPQPVGVQIRHWSSGTDDMSRWDGDSCHERREPNALASGNTLWKASVSSTTTQN